MKQLKKTILTLVALLAVTTGAWAQGKLIYEKDFSSDASYPFYLDAADKTGASATVTDGLLVLTNPSVQTNNWDVQPEIGRLTSAAPTTQGNTYRVVMQYKTTVAGSVTFALGAQDWSNADWSGQTITVSNDFQTCEAYFNNYPYSNSESHILLQFGELVGTITIKKVEVYELYPVPLTWNAATKTGTFTQPAGNVTVSVEYYGLATLAFQGLTAAEDAAAKTEAPLAVLAENAVTGGTLMYYVAPDENFSQADAIALAEDAWSAAIPTAETIDAAGGTYYVWYYIKGDDEHSDTDPKPLAVTVQPEPTYTVEFAEGTPESDKWSAEPKADVKKGQTVTVTYTGSKKVLGVKAEKKAKAGIVNPAVGQIIGSDGKNYDANATLPSGVIAVAMIAYVGSETGVDGYTHGLALALTDEGKMDWYKATGPNGAAAHTPAAPTPMTSSWMLPSEDQWKKMMDACKNVLGTQNNYKDLRDGFSGITGANNLLSDDRWSNYWTSTEKDSGHAWYYYFHSGIWNTHNKTEDTIQVRACLAF